MEDGLREFLWKKTPGTWGRIARFQKGLQGKHSWFLGSIFPPAEIPVSISLALFHGIRVVWISYNLFYFRPVCAVCVQLSLIQLLIRIEVQPFAWYTLSKPTRPRLVNATRIGLVFWPEFYLLADFIPFEVLSGLWADPRGGTQSCIKFIMLKNLKWSDIRSKLLPSLPHSVETERNFKLLAFWAFLQASARLKPVSKRPAHSNYTVLVVTTFLVSA